MKKIIPVVLVTVLVALGGNATAADEKMGGGFRFDPVSQTSRALVFKNVAAGYKIFVNPCKTCHHRVNSAGAPFLHTESKNMRGWNRVFLEKYPKCAGDGSWSKLSQEDLMVLNDYLYSKASDTYDPYNAKSCG